MGFLLRKSSEAGSDWPDMSRVLWDGPWLVRLPAALPHSLFPGSRPWPMPPHCAESYQPCLADLQERRRHGAGPRRLPRPPPAIGPVKGFFPGDSEAAAVGIRRLTSSAVFGFSSAWVPEMPMPGRDLRRRRPRRPVRLDPLSLRKCDACRHLRRAGCSTLPPSWGVRAPAQTSTWRHPPMTLPPVSVDSPAGDLLWKGGLREGRPSEAQRTDQEDRAALAWNPGPLQVSALGQVRTRSRVSFRHTALW